MPGPYYFAYAADGEPFDEAIHNREDEAVLSLTLTHNEGDFAGLTVTVLNPAPQGLLAPGREQWAWVSWDDGSAIVPLFYGRLVAVPEQIDGETVRLLFSAKPTDYDEIKKAHADTLRVLPYWDTVWLMGDLSDDDSVLNAYGARWHIDRTTLALTTSDELTGEDGTLSFGEADHTYDAFELSYTNPPLSQIELEGTLTWSQTGAGTIDLTGDIFKAFSAQKTIYTYTAHGIITTLTGDGLAQSWPKGGTSLGGGWTVSNDTFIGDASGAFTRYQYTVKYRGLRSDFATRTELLSQYYFNGYQDYEITYDVAAFQQQTRFDWAADKKRTEIFRCTLVADIQPLLAEPENQENISKISISASNTVTEPDAGGVMPIGDKRRKSYLNTDRGAYSVDYLLLLARAELRRRTRAVEVRCRVKWQRGIAASLRKSAQIVDRRLPGGEAVGKIVAYELSAAGTGEFHADITIGCAIGRGGTVTAAAGETTYVDLGFVDAGYQQTTGAEVTVPTGDIVYQSLDAFPVDDDGIDLLTLDERTAVESLVVTNGLGTQVTTVTNADDPANAIRTAPTQVCVQLRPVADLEFETIYQPLVQQIPLPRTIDLEAA